MTSPRASPTLPTSSPPSAITIPARDGSPIRRRRSGSQASESEPARPRLSPTLARTLNPNDPELRARQRELDLDMAAHLSRARQNSVSISPVVSPFHPLPPASSEPSALAASGILPPFSEGEEREFEAARAGGNAPTIDIDAKSDFHFSRSDPELRHGDEVHHRHHLSAGHDPDLLFASHGAEDDATPMQLPPRRGSGVHDEGGEPFLPSYAPQMYESHFDFVPMEEYAREEKHRLGLDSPTGLPNGGLRWMDLTTASRRLQTSDAGPSGSNSGLLAEPDRDHPQSPAATGNSGEPGASSTVLPRLRHRKLSQSKATPRSQRPGKKTALFEGAAGAPPPTLGTLIGQRALPSYENVLGDRTPAVGNSSGQGHDRPYRFSFYSNAQSATIHARSLAELPAEGQTFEELFTGVQRDSDTSAKASAKGPMNGTEGNAIGSGRVSVVGSAVGTPSVLSHIQEANRRSTPARPIPAVGNDPAPGYGTISGTNSKTALASNPPSQEHNTWWLDVLNPTDEEMKMLAKVFSIHPLTTEDILMEETREKIELFRNYYLVCFRGFDQDPYSPTHLEPLNMYIIVFREGTLSFHFRATPHPQNVRRRIKQLKDYISVSSDWISYALIDDITDAFGPLIQSIEYEVDSIDELVLILKEAEQSDMLRRIGTCRKKVMGLLRLMGNKADVVKGLAKRCNENWRVAPTSDIGLYLSDIQDHLITMTQNLNHYEKILSRSHSNYLAQISIEMTEANNQINDVLSKMTALGTVLIPMNLVTGLWGMNVNVPGQEASGLVWFFSILAGLVAFAVVGGYVTFRLMAGR